MINKLNNEYDLLKNENIKYDNIINKINMNKFDYIA